MKSIKAKLIISLSIGILLVLTLIIANNSRISAITEQNNQNVLSMITKLSNEYISYRVQKSDDIAIVLSNSSHLNTIARSLTLGDTGTNKAINAITNEVLYQAELNEEIKSIYLYMEDERVFIDSYGNVQFGEYINDIVWVDKYAKGDNSIRWIESKDERSDNLQLISIIYRADKFNSNLSTPVYLSINYDKEEFYELISRTKLGDETIAALVNFDDDLFICEVDTLTKIDLRHIIYDRKAYLSEKFEITVDIVGYGVGRLIYTPLDFFDGAIVLFIPDKFTQVITQTEQSLIIISIIILMSLYIMWMIYFVKKNIDQPIEIILEHMKKTGEGKFSETINEKRKDEFGQLYTSYNSMVQEVEILIQELYQQQLVKSELELKVLQEKINPHFLYNTLDTINWIAKEHQIPDISKMVLDLSTMYRMTFNKGNDMISIKDMLVGISCYLSIQKVRYGDSFSFSFSMEKNLMNFEILNLIVQTLVENAIVHGMSEKSSQGLITINAHVENRILIIKVADNGKGMSNEMLQLIRQSINSKMIGSESGLRNVQKRIKLYYGEAYGIEVDSIINNGTIITIRLPFEGEKYD